MPESSRRDFLATLGAAACLRLQPRGVIGALHPTPPPGARRVRVRAITAGVDLRQLADRRAIEAALASLARARRRFEAEGYEVQTTRVTLPSIVARLDATARTRALADLAAIDGLVAAAGAVCGLGRVSAGDRTDEGRAPGAAELVRAARAWGWRRSFVRAFRAAP